ncbi:hypothetical protein ACFX2I_015085 [Malus domestica]
MDPIKLLKFQAVHKHKKHHHPLSNFFLYFFTALTCSLFCFSPLWLPSVSSSMKFFVLVTIPKISSVFLSSKFVFILGNLIVVALIGESKIFSTGTSPSNIVDQYESMKRVQSQQSYSGYQERELKTLNTLLDEERVVLKRTCGDLLEAVEEKGLVGESEEVMEEVKEDLDEDEDDDELNLPDEDQKLNQRADDFIARVNERRRFELLFVTDGL